MKKPVMCLLSRGTPQFPRFAIGEREGKVWDGTGWTDDADKGTLYSEAIAAARECQDILRDAYKDAKHTKFYTIPIQVEVQSDTDLSAHEIREWLQKSIHVGCSYNQNGNGPTDDTLVLTNVMWGDFSQEQTGE
jgi:hypothetical protein